MEIRLKYSYSGLVLFSIVFIAFIVGGFLLSYVCWILGILWGGIVVFCIVDAVKHGGDAVVITEEGVWVDGEFEVDWSEIDHCYVSIRTGADHSDNYCLVFVTKQRNRCDLLLDRYIVKYIFSTKKLAKDINHLLGKEMCHMTPADKAYEKRYCLSVWQQLKPTVIYCVVLILIAYIISLIRR